MANLAGAAVCLFSPLAAAYRTAGDLAEFDGTEKVRWASGVANFVLVDDLPAGVGGAEINADLVRAALRAWEDVECTSFQGGLAGLTSTPAAYGDDRNTIQWVSVGWEDLGFQPEAAGATDIRYEEVNGEWVIAEADVYLNAQDHTWATGTATGEQREIVGVLTHELGHALGLLHPCEEEKEPVCNEQMVEAPSTMFPAYSDGQLSLEQDDEEGICFLYPSCTKGSCGADQTCTTLGCVDKCEDLLCRVGESCVDGECLDPFDPCQAGSPECTTCVADEDCGFGFSCEDGECSFTAVVLGDPCEKGPECASGRCSDAGYCSPYCNFDDDCGSEGMCDEDEHLCSVDQRQPFQGACDSADDCLGAKCLADLTDEPICTRTCSSDVNDCPFEWECGDVEGEAVCVPPFEPDKPKNGCGCHFPGEPAGLPRPHLVLILAPLTILRLRRRLQSSVRNASIDG